MEGNIIIDGVLASCYASFDHNLAHLGMVPIKLFPEITDWILGWDNAGPSYVNIVQELNNLMFLFEQQK